MRIHWHITRFDCSLIAIDCRIKINTNVVTIALQKAEIILLPAPSALHLVKHVLPPVLTVLEPHPGFFSGMGINR